MSTNFRQKIVYVCWQSFLCKVTENYEPHSWIISFVCLHLESENLSTSSICICNELCSVVVVCKTMYISHNYIIFIFHIILHLLHTFHLWTSLKCHNTKKWDMFWPTGVYWHYMGTCHVANRFRRKGSNLCPINHKWNKWK